MQQESPPRLLTKSTPDDQARVDQEEQVHAKSVRDGLIAWRALSRSGQALTAAAETRDVAGVIDVLLCAASNFVFLEWQSSIQRGDVAGRKKLAIQWQEIADSRATLERVRR
jgi:hypothetical protein